jgi:plastocyanin
MRRGMLLCMIVTVAAVVGMPGVASAGGGCHSGVTESDATGQDAATVRLIDACFTATTTTVDPGTAVTFVNDDDGITHNVGGNQWGHFDDLLPGDAFTVSFDEAGTYPFACTYHPGMTGAIVVGDGRGAAGAETITVEPFAPASTPKTVTRVVTRTDGLPAGFVILAAGLGALLGAGAVTLGRARSRRAPVTAA